MAISINGNGTITGIVAGGLPDGSVAAADIADNAVTTLKILNDQITNAKVDFGELCYCNY